jgi:hypothetical protein
LPWNRRREPRAAASTSKLDRPAACLNGSPILRQPFASAELSRARSRGLRRDPRIARDCAGDAWWLFGRCNHWIAAALFASVSDRITFNGRRLSAQEMLPEALPAVERHKVILRRGVFGLVFVVDRLEDGHVAGRVVSGSVFVRVGDIPYSFPDLKLPPTARDGLIIGPARPGRKPDDTNDLPARFSLGDRTHPNHLFARNCRGRGGLVRWGRNLVPFVSAGPRQYTRFRFFQTNTVIPEVLPIAKIKARAPYSKYNGAVHEDCTNLSENCTRREPAIFAVSCNLRSENLRDVSGPRT